MSRARVLYDYDAKDSDQLSIKAGQLLEIKGAATAEGWVLAKSKGQEGYVPAQYIEEIGSGGPPPKPPGAAGGGTTFNMPKARPSATSKEGRNTNNSGPPPQTNKPQPVRSVSSSNTVFGGRKESLNAPMKPDDAYSIFAYFMEWFGVIGMFLAGLFAFMYGTIVIDPEGLISMIFGFGAMLGASILALSITVMRDSVNCAMQSPPLSRCILFCCCMCCCGGGFPIGALGDGALCFAALANLLAHVKDASAAVSSSNWSDFCTDCISCSSIMRAVFVVFFIAADAGVFYFGYLNGYFFAVGVSASDRVFLDPISWGVAEGFGTIISFNIALIFLFACFGFQKFLIDRAEASPNCCNNAIAWFVDPDAQIFFHTLVSISLIINVFLHMIANFAAFENSGPYRSYLTIFGIVPVITGMIAFGLLTILLAGSHADIKRNLERLFRITHLVAVFLTILLIFHGPGGLGRNYWKWIAGPLALYMVDVLFRAGWVSSGNN